MNFLDIILKVFKNWWQNLLEFSPNILVGIVVFLVFVTISTYVSTACSKIIIRIYNNSNNKSLPYFLPKILRFIIIVMGLFIALEIMHLGGIMTKILSSLGIAGIIAGVALKDLVSSAFSGILTNIDKSFEIGDYIQLSTTTGTVEDIGLLTVKLKTDDGKIVYIPNQLIYAAPFTNFTKSEKRRAIISIEIPNTEDLEMVLFLVNNETSLLPFVENKEAIETAIINLKSGVYSIEVRFWLKNKSDLREAKTMAYLNIKNRFLKENIQTIQPNIN